MAESARGRELARSWQRLREFAERRPNLTAWAALSVAMVAILLWSARDVELLLRQRLALVAATILLAGACVWIITWEEDDSEEPPP